MRYPAVNEKDLGDRIESVHPDVKKNATEAGIVKGSLIENVLRYSVYL